MTDAKKEEPRYTLDEARKLLCEHDWRIDPKGWQPPLINWGNRSRSEYRTLVCAKCGDDKEEKRIINLVEQWKPVEK